MTIIKEVDRYTTCTFRNYTLRWVDVSNFYSVSICWHSIETSDGIENHTTVILLPFGNGDPHVVGVASLKDAFALVRALGVMV